MLLFKVEDILADMKDIFFEFADVQSRIYFKFRLGTREKPITSVA